MTLYLLLALAYLLGSIPSAVWYGRMVHGIDVREHGSKSAGATNTLRVLGNKAGFIVLFFDFLKGFLATDLVYLLNDVQPGTTEFIHRQMLFGIIAVCGHIWPLFAGFRGGKGVATLLGLVVALDYRLALICLVVFVVSVTISRFISVGSMLAGIASPFIAGILYNWEQPSILIFFTVVALMLVYTHRTNVKRLMNGTENKVSFKKKA